MPRIRRNPVGSARKCDNANGVRRGDSVANGEYARGRGGGVLINGGAAGMKSEIIRYRTNFQRKLDGKLSKVKRDRIQRCVRKLDEWVRRCSV